MRLSRLRPWVLASGALVLILAGGTGLDAQPVVPHLAAQGQAIPDRYIVVLRPDVPSAAAVARDLTARHGLAVSHVYETALKGFAAHVPAGRRLALQLDPRVAFIEPDQLVYAFAQVVPTGVQRVFARGNLNLDIDGRDDYRVDVDVAVIDTGIADHPDLNIVARANCSGGGPFKESCADGGTDGNGHGTHVAGIIGALDNSIGVVGIAPGARLWSVKVLGDNGSGYMSWIIAGVDWVTARATRIEVANMSLGCECTSNALDTAISRSVAAGLVYVVSAGNSDKDASTFSPANHPDAITVSALADFDGADGALAGPTCRTDQDDTLGDFSNWGHTIEVAAPGACILSTWKDGGYNTISGTSMAAPHVAGTAAILASGPNKPTRKNDVLAIRDTIMTEGNLNWTDDSGDGLREPLLDLSNTGTFAPFMVAGAAGGADNPPSVSVTHPEDGASVSGTVNVQASATDDSGVSQVQFFIDGALIGTDSNGGDGWSVGWNTTTVADGAHTITATAIDSGGQKASHAIAVTVANSAGGGDGSASTMGVYDIAWSSGRHLDVTVNIRRDSDSSGSLSGSDATVGGAGVTFRLTRDTNGNGSFECGSGDECWTYAGNTNSSGNFKGKLLHAPSGVYQTTVISVSANGLSWDPTLDRDNPDTSSR